MLIANLYGPKGQLFTLGSSRYVLGNGLASHDFIERWVIRRIQKEPRTAYDGGCRAGHWDSARNAGKGSPRQMADSMTIRRGNMGKPRAWEGEASPEPGLFSRLPALRRAWLRRSYALPSNRVGLRAKTTFQDREPLNRKGPDRSKSYLTNLDFIA